MRNQLPIKFQIKSHNGSSEKRIHWNSFLPVLISILGIGAWIAGKAFYTGYWNAAGIPSITSMSLQETAFAGFAAAYYNWTWLPLVLGLYGLYFAVLAVDLKSRKPIRIRWFNNSIKWWEENIEIDKRLGQLVSSFFIAAVLFAFLILIPLTIWIVKAMDEGKIVFEKQVCFIRTAKTLPSSIMLTDGNMINGKILDRSEKATVILDKTSIYVIATGEKNNLLDSTDIQHVKCS